jgi:FAD/FMN-containing dehydrogenase
VEALAGIVGSRYVTTNKADLYIYSRDMSIAEPAWPDVAVLPASLDELKKIVAYANTERIPLVPYIAGGNIAGLTIPLKGGITLDLKRMDRILEVNETDMYALVEPGVTFGHMKAFSPPSTGVMSNSIVQGLDNVSFRYGAASRWVSGMEVLLATGELVRIGSCAVSDIWQAVAPMPEITGLFLGWQGATGIVTKVAVSLWPKVKHAAGLHFQTRDMEGAERLFKVISRTRIPDDLIGTSFALSIVSMKAMEHQKSPISPAIKTGPDDPEFTISADVSGNSEGELKAKLKVVEEVVEAEMKGDVIYPEPVPSNRAAFPMQNLPVLSGGGGLMWVGCYGPMSNWLKTARKGCELQDKYDLTRSCYTRVMDEGHFVGLRWMLPYDKGDPDMVDRIMKCCDEQLDLVLENGFVPYKTPYWAVRKIEEKAGPEWVELHRRIKKLLDPNNIMNPGRWGAPAE